MKQYYCNVCDLWEFYVKYLPNQNYYTTKAEKINVIKNKNIEIVDLPIFDFCPWCSQRLISKNYNDNFIIKVIKRLKILWENLKRKNME